jgi:hypothetical protein
VGQGQLKVALLASVPSTFATAAGKIKWRPSAYAQFKSIAMAFCRERRGSIPDRHVREKQDEWV